MTSDSFRLDDPENFKILVATDIHLGFEEKDLKRADDTFNTFEEVLQLAKKHQVDFILLAGDLFHVNQPSVTCLERCISLLRTHCLGDKPVNIEFCSDQSVIFKHCNNPIVNFEDQNINVSIPVFSIHGNHDDPCGYREVSCMDLLSSMGLINYFGKQTDLKDIKIFPILLKKGSNKIGLYGLSHIRDERLERLFRNKKVRMLQSEEFKDEWFNIFVCHQNRAKRPGTKHLPEDVIPDHIMLTIWGHEHQSLIDPTESAKCFISQPGSTVATSMCEGEAGSKYVGLLTIKGKQFHMEPLELKTVRQMHFETMKLSECDEDISDIKLIQEFVKQKIENILEDLSKNRSGHPKQPIEPLIRLRIEYTCETQHFNGIQFGQQFQDRVANFSDMILLRMEKKSYEKKSKCIDDDALANIMEDQEMDKIEHIVDEYFRTADKSNQLQLLSVDGMAEGVDWVVNKSCSDAIKQIVEHQTKKVKAFVMKQDDLNEDNIAEYLTTYHNLHTQKSKEDVDNVRKVLSSSQKFQSQSFNSSYLANQHDSDDESNISPVNSADEQENGSSSSSTTRGRGSRGQRGRGTRATGRATTRARGKGRGQMTLNFL